MANITVDHDEFEVAAAAIDSYVAKHRKNMRSMNTAVESLGMSWAGVDYEQVKREWNQLDAAGSTSQRMIESLENYARALRAAAKKYRDAQSNAFNRANKLPRY